MLRTTHSFIAGNGSAESSTITTVQQREVLDRVFGHYAISQLQTPLLFGCLVLLSFLGIGFFSVITLVEALVVPRQRRVSAWDQPTA